MLTFQDIILELQRFWARQGCLRPVRLPGRKTALGYLASDISNILTRKA